jgi:hypothetical protein
MKMMTMRVVSVVAFSVTVHGVFAQESTTGVVTNRLSAQIEDIGNCYDIETLGVLMSDLVEQGSEHAELHTWCVNKALPSIEKRVDDLLFVSRKELDRESMLSFARRLGQIRALRIPGYNYIPESPNGIGMKSLARSKTPGMNPEMIEEPELKREVEREWKEWRYKQGVYYVQSFLKRKDTNATEHFIKEASIYLRFHPNDMTFVDQATMLGRLTAEERQQLENALKVKN